MTESLVDTPIKEKKVIVTMSRLTTGQSRANVSFASAIYFISLPLKKKKIMNFKCVLFLSCILRVICRSIKKT